ncbi:hypothetical protein [Haloarchaeobius iranensis]|uniref:Uncharacterized protein n=1 Tax=Haloarchaeobius iranensis TaxID=996166 RepID=A0A1G9ZI80_9EURY|nr:hypothetical protein [Haloarchaeobius iranensis]SDN20246.1 hypothetical protein SAMN05192554_12032 [Haloarchaeobius iranensis]
MDSAFGDTLLKFAMVLGLVAVTAANLSLVGIAEGAMMASFLLGLLGVALELNDSVSV